MNNEIYFLGRITKREYAKRMLYEGELYFNYPINWIKEAQNGNIGQGDLYEGVFSNMVSHEFQKLRFDAEVVSIDGKHFLRSRSVVTDWPCISFYGATKLTEKEEEKEDGSIAFDIGKEYVDSFGKNDIEDIKIDDRMQFIVISLTKRFLDRLRDFFRSKGMVEERDYFMHHLEYRVPGRNFLYKLAPYELFSKEYVFHKQKEFRIVLNPNCQRVKELLRDGHKLFVGSLEDSISLKRFPSSGGSVIVNPKNHSLSITGISPFLNGPLQEWPFNALVAVMRIAGRNAHFELDGKTVDSYSFWIKLEFVLASKYCIQICQQGFDDDRDEAITLYFHADDVNTINKKEEIDCYYYLRDNTFRAPVLSAIMGETGHVAINYRVKKR